MESCIFCRIVAGEIPSAKVYEDEEILIFKDINPIAKVHLLCVPKEHYKTVAELNSAREDVLARAFSKSGSLAPSAAGARFPPCDESGRERRADGPSPAHPYSRR